MNQEKLVRAEAKEDAQLFQWILDQLRRGFRLRGWQGDERQAERDLPSH